jgi:hypothetical protein
MIFTEMDENQNQKGKSGWPEIIEIVFKLCVSENEQQMKAGLRIFDGLFTYVSHEFKDYVPQFHAIF